jgi:hypothetical protein
VVHRSSEPPVIGPDKKKAFGSVNPKASAHLVVFRLSSHASAIPAPPLRHTAGRRLAAAHDNPQDGRPAIQQIIRTAQAPRQPLSTPPSWTVAGSRHEERHSPQSTQRPPRGTREETIDEETIDGLSRFIFCDDLRSLSAISACSAVNAVASALARPRGMAYTYRAVCFGACRKTTQPPGCLDVCGCGNEFATGCVGLHSRRQPGSLFVSGTVAACCSLAICAQPDGHGGRISLG